ncbi:Peptidase C14 caspase catalytic subunit p20 [Oceanicaulis sp. 350]|nr:Peptidase C14 caspase catalytic subunit p20 [Oceanicaulis sp. 350]
MNRSMAALVIGNAKYADGAALANPTNDANDLGAKLKGYGFEVIIATDCTVAEMDKRLKEFKDLIQSYEVGLFFFAGHGIQIEGSNYLLAIDTNIESESDAKYSSLPFDKVLDIMDKSKAKTKIAVLDACRNNPWERRWYRSGLSRGLASVYAPKGTIIGFATSPGEVAYDGSGRNGTYTAALLQHIDTPDCSIEAMFKRVRNTVAASTAGKQTSWEHTSLSGEFYFNLSLGNLIDDYDGTALADSLFILDESKPSNVIIAGLKRLNWYKQNAALKELSAAVANRAGKDSLFVLGRNIYQAACGSSDEAVRFINEFVTATRSYGNKKRKSLLDGILFEIFFDSKGNLRKGIKGNFFDEVFELQRHEILKSSFEFISECLVAAQANFYALPGKNHDLAISVSSKKIDDRYHIEAVYLGGSNILRVEGESLDDDNEVVYSKITPSRLNEKLCLQLVVPARSLNITYTPPEAASALSLRIPVGWAVSKET